MKNEVKNFLAVFALLLLFLMHAPKANAQLPLGIAEIIKAGVVKVIKAIDLKIQRLQNETIMLQNAQQVIENELTKSRLEEIAEWNFKQKEQYRIYYDELRKVKAIIADYKRVKDIMQKQLAVVKEYRRVWDLLKNDEHFSADEISYMGKVYSGILKRSIENVEEISMIVKSYSLQMSDGKRLEMINRTADKVDENFTDLRQFNTQNILLSVGRAKSQLEIKSIKQLYGLE